MDERVVHDAEEALMNLFGALVDGASRERIIEELEEFGAHVEGMTDEDWKFVRVRICWRDGTA